MKNWRLTNKSGALLALATLAIAACSPLPTHDRAPSRPPDVSMVPDAVPQEEPRSRYGNPSHYEVFGKRYHVMDSADGYAERGVASWYGQKFHGRRTSSGETYDMYAMTAAHKALPLPTYVSVTNLKNGRSVVVKVNDRGPFVHNRIIDLSYSAAARLGMIENGTGLVEVTALTGQSAPLLAQLPNNPAPASSPPPLAVPTTARMEPVITQLPEDHVQSIDTPQSGEIFVQLGAFADPLNANRLGEQLKARGFSEARISADPVGERIVYRVRIGPLADVPEFDSKVAELESFGFTDLHLVYE